MPSYTYKGGMTQVSGTGYRSLSVFQDDIEHFKMLELKAGPPPRYSHKDIYGDECRELTALGANTLRQVRRLMKYGPLNNTMAPESFAFEAGSFEDAKLLAYNLNRAVDTYWETMKGLRGMSGVKNAQLWDSAAYADAARTAGGGVCSAIAYVTMGVLTQQAHNITACIYYNAGADHSYVLIRKPETDWFVVDPWVRYPSVCPWRYNYFGASGGTHMLFDITHPTAEPFGVAIPSGIKEASRKAVSSQQLDVPFQRKIWGHAYNVEEAKRTVYLPVCGPKEWGDKVAPNFDVRQLWA